MERLSRRSVFSLVIGLAHVPACTSEPNDDPVDGDGTSLPSQPDADGTPTQGVTMSAPAVTPGSGGIPSQPDVSPGPRNSDAPSVSPTSKPVDAESSSGGLPGAPSIPQPVNAGGSTAGGGQAGADSGGGSAGDPVEPGPVEPVPVELGDPVVYVGGFDYGSDSYPLRAYDLDLESGALTERGSPFDAGPNPSYLALAPNGRFLYAANERDDDLGGLTALAIADDGTLTPINHQTGSDGGFTYVVVDPSGKFAFGASYNGGSVSVFPVEDDGALGPELDNVDFGDGAQSHCVGFDPSGQFVLVPNKGNDEVAVLRLTTEGTLMNAGTAASPAGAGPRHIALHPGGTFAAVMNELSSSVTVYDVAEGGTLTTRDSVSALPADYNGNNTGAHIEFSPDGKYAYASNRGHDSIAIFAVDEAARTVEVLGHESTRGSSPRDFDVDVTGRVLIAANQDSGNVAVFGIGADGNLQPLGDVVSGLPSPSAIQIVYLPR